MLAVTIGALLALGPAGALHLDADFRATQSARSTAFSNSPDLARAELAVAPEIALATQGSLRVRLAYAPLWTVPADLAGNTEGLSGPLDERSVVLHRATASAELPVGLWRLRASGALGAGETLLIGDPSTGTAPAGPVSTTARIPYFGTDVAAGAIGEPTHRTTVSLGAAFTHAGGDGDAARRRLPLLEALTVTSSAGLRIAPRDVVALELLGNRTRVGEAAVRDSAYLRAGAVWGHQLDRHTLLRTAAGLAYSRYFEDPVPVPDADDESPLLPWLEETVEFVPGGIHPSLHATVGLEPTVDRFSGALGLRGNARAALAWAPFHRWSFGAAAGASSLFAREGLLPSSAPHTTIADAGLSAGYQLAHEVRLLASGSSTWQVTDRADLPQFREDLLTIGLEAGLLAL
jgi:hypothetical protein